MFCFQRLYSYTGKCFAKYILYGVVIFIFVRSLWIGMFLVWTLQTSNIIFSVKSKVQEFVILLLRAIPKGERRWRFRMGLLTSKLNILWKLAEDRWKNRKAPLCFGVFIAYVISMAFAANHKADKPRHRLKSNNFVVKTLWKRAVVLTVCQF